jgi:hypothetical protein
MTRSVIPGGVFLDVQGQGKTAICPTILGNGILKLVVYLVFHFYAQEAPKGPPPPEVIVGSMTRAWFDLRRDVRLEISESLAIGVGLINLSVIAFGAGIVYLGRFALDHWARSYLVMAVLCFLVARMSHVIGTVQWLSGLEVIRSLIWSRTERGADGPEVY